MKKHPDKHIQSAIEYALLQGWVWIARGIPRMHSAGYGAGHRMMSTGSIR